MSGEKFGAFIRARREAKEIGLREMAKMIGVSPTYVSKVERDEFPPPAENKVRLIAGVIGCDVDELLARAGKVATDLSEIIKRNPVEVAALLRTTKGSRGWLARRRRRRISELRRGGDYLKRCR